MINSCILLKASLYLEVLACTTMEATKFCGVHSLIGCEAVRWLKYARLGHKILQQCSTENVSILDHLPIPGGSDTKILQLVFKNSSNISPFNVQSVALFHLLSQWTRTGEEVVNDILLIETWLSNQVSLESVVIAMKQLVVRLRMKPARSVVNSDTLYLFIVNILMPYVIESKTGLPFDQLDSLLQCIRDMLVFTFNKGQLLSKIQNFEASKIVFFLLKVNRLLFIFYTNF